MKNKISQCCLLSMGRRLNKKIRSLTVAAIAVAAVSLGVQVASAQWVVNFQWQAAGWNGLVPTVYNGQGVLGTGTYWNGICGSTTVAAGAASYTSFDGLADDGVTEENISLTVQVDNNEGNPGANVVLEAYGECYGPNRTLTFNNLPDGIYNLVLFSDDAWDTFATTFTFNGVTNSTTNVMLDVPNGPAGFIQNDNYVVFENLLVTNGSAVLNGTYSSNVNSGEGLFNGAQLQYVGPIASAVAPVIQNNGALPLSTTVYAGTPVQFTVLGLGTPAPTYLWYVNNSLIGGATHNSYSFTASFSPSFTVVFV